MSVENEGKQKSVFLQSEGDAWYERNKSGMNGDFLRSYLESLGPYINKNSKVLEIGCSSGENLHFLNEKFKCHVYGVDPSAAAISEGSKKFRDNSKIHLQLGTAESFSFDFQFDIIIFGFCLYVCDRELLTKIIYNCDRHLNSPGYLGIVDFDPPIPTKNIYTHVPGLFSYKMDYSKLFLSNPSYELVTKTSLSHTKKHFDDVENERVGAWLLYKNLQKGYYSLSTNS